MLSFDRTARSFRRVSRTIIAALALALLPAIAGCSSGGGGGGGGGLPPGSPPSAPTSLSYPPAPTFFVGVPSADLIPTVGGGTPDSWSIAPALPLGIVIDPNTGVIAGVPVATATLATYTVTASNAAGSVTGTIDLEVQIPTLPLVTFDSAADAAGEASGTTTVGVSLSAASTSLVTVEIQVLGSATPGIDFVSPATTVAFPVGVTTASVDIALIDDGDFEGDETVILSLINPMGALVGVPPTFALTVQDDETGPTIEFSGTVFTVSESDPAFDLTVTLSMISGVDATVTYTVSGSAIEPDDYTIEASPLVIPAGSLSGTISVDPQDDATPEAAETIVVTLDGVVGGQLGGSTVATVTIIDGAACSIDYPTVDAIYGPGVPIAPNVPTVSCGMVSNWVEDPPFPAGLSLDPNSGVISGTPAMEQLATTYVISALGPGGSTVSAIISITVSPRFILSGDDPTVPYNSTTGMASFAVSLGVIEDPSAGSPNIVRGYSFGMQVDPTQLTVDTLDEGAATLGFNGGTGVDFLAAEVVTGGFTVGAVFDFQGVDTLIASTISELIVAQFSTVPSFLQGNLVGETITLPFDDTLGAGSTPVANVVTVNAGISVDPVLVHPTITFVP